MGFYSYALYKKCFDWAYGSHAVTPGICNYYLEAEANRRLVTSDGKVFCIKSE